MSVEVTPLHPAVGAAVRGVDFSAPMSPEVFEAVHAAWMKHLVLNFPEQDITDEQHVAVSRQFGELEVHHQAIIRSERTPEIFRVSNVDEHGEIIPPAHPTARQIAQAQRWHTDSSFRREPAMGSMLHGVEVTQEGGKTCFINMYAVYEALPAHLRKQVEGRAAQHNFEYLHVVGGLKPLSPAEREAMPAIMQPMVRRHPVTGRKSLYISPIYNDAVEGMSESESQALVQELSEFASQDEFVYRHTWRPHDIVLWDNRCTMHLVTPYDPAARRVMHRTTIAGTGPVVAA